MHWRTTKTVTEITVCTFQIVEEKTLWENGGGECWLSTPFQYYFEMITAAA